MVHHDHKTEQHLHDVRKMGEVPFRRADLHLLKIPHRIVSRVTEKTVDTRRIVLRRKLTDVGGQFGRNVRIVLHRTHIARTVGIRAQDVPSREGKRSDGFHPDERKTVLGGVVVRTLQQHRLGIQVAYLQVNAHRGLKVGREDPITGLECIFFHGFFFFFLCALYFLFSKRRRSRM